MAEPNPNVPSRSEIKIGQKVWAVEKRNYATGELTEGIVKRILTSKAYHPRGIKVMFEDGTVARVQSLAAPEIRPPAKKTPSPDFNPEEELR